MNIVGFEEIVDSCIDFTRRLIRTPSMPRHESAIADLIVREMRDLEFDKVSTDDVGNVTGVIFGSNPNLGALVLNSHLDHVDPGELSLWSVPPYEGVLVDDHIIGRGSADIKGPLAVQIHSMASLKRLAIIPKRNIVFSGVVEEEVGGAGAVHWVKEVDYPIELIMLGEPSNNNISLGHRGILQMWVTFHGKSAHASVPTEAINPNYALATFLNRLSTSSDKLGSHSLLGESTVSPTIIEVDTTSINVTPAWSRVLLDFRTSSESPNSLMRFIGELAYDMNYRLSDAWAREMGSPLPDSDELIFGYSTEANSAAVQRAKALIAAGMGWEPEFTTYDFATDGRHFTDLGVPIIGYSPAAEDQAHVVDEKISLRMIEDSIKGHISLLSQF